MRAADHVTDFIDGLISWLSRSIGQVASKYCDLETSDVDGRSIVAQDGSLLSVLRIDGNKMLIGRDEFAYMVGSLTSSLQSYLNESGHMLQVYFVRDPDGAAELVKNSLLPARARAKDLGLEFSDIFDDQEAELTRWVADEHTFFVLWTRPSALTKTELKRERKQIPVNGRDPTGRPLTDAQKIDAAIPALRDRHSAFVNAMVSDLRDLSMVVECLEVHDALRAVRQSIDSEFTPANWRPALPGDRIAARMPERINDMSVSVLWPTLASQLFPRDAERLDTRTVRVGDRIYAPLYIDLAPQEIYPFVTLLHRTLSSDVPLPWRISFLVEGNGLQAMAFKNSLAPILAWASSSNSMIKEALAELTERAKAETIVKLRIALSTWAPAGRAKLLRSRAARLAKAVSGWGNCEVKESAGDPVEAFVSSALAVVHGSVATTSAAPLGDVVQMLPMTRPSSQWHAGAVLFTSPDGKLMAYQPGSALQQTNISLFFAGPGSGKSVLMSMIHKATSLAPSGGELSLPRIGILDIGPSSYGVVSLFKSALPDNQRHLVNFYRLRMTPEFAFNPFDTQLGCRQPLPEERAFLVDFLTMLAMPAETGEPFEGAANMAGLIVDEMYKSLADDELGRPHTYTPRVNDDIDALLISMGWTPPEGPTWWDVVEFLFDQGRPYEASVAQRYAMPLLSDAAAAARSDAVRDIYGKIRPGGPDSETLPEMFSRTVQESIREYPVLGQPTRFDIGESRITAIDLDEVAKSGGPQSNKRTAIMYTIAYYALTHHFTLTDANVRDMPKRYQAHHQKRAHSIQRELKTICCDEFHRTGEYFSKPVRQRVKVHMREGRKWNVQVMLASQQLRDFDDAMISMATNVYMMESPAEQDITEIANRFGLSATEAMALRTRIRGPRRGGGTFFARIRTKEGTIKQLFRNPAGAIELWAYSTTPEDNDIRQMVYGALGPSEGRRALAASYPGGTAKPQLDRRKNEMAMQGEFDDARVRNLYETMANEVINAWHRRFHDKKASQQNGA